MTRASRQEMATNGGSWGGAAERAGCAGHGFPPGYRLAPLAWSDQKEVAHLLVRAFAGDPLVTAICGAADRVGQRRMFWSFLLSVRAHALSPQPAWVVRSERGEFAAVVLVSRPGMGLQAPADTWFSLLGMSRMGLKATRRSIEAAQAIARHAPPGPFTYVRTLAVDPEHQRRGLGSGLLAHVFAHSPLHWPVYLETAREQNLWFYSRQGFRCVGTFRCHGVEIWRMLRRPGP